MLKVKKTIFDKKIISILFLFILALTFFINFDSVHSPFEDKEARFVLNENTWINEDIINKSKLNLSNDSKISFSEKLDKIILAGNSCYMDSHCGPCETCDSGSCNSDCSSGENCCLDSCCPGTCCNAVTGACCTGTQECCNGNCCDGTCINNSCCPSDHIICNGVCFPPDSSALCNGSCCDGECINNSCCTGEVGYENVCSNNECVLGTELVCNPSQDCSDSSECCPSGQEYCNGVCCENCGPDPCFGNLVCDPPQGCTLCSICDFPVPDDCDIVYLDPSCSDPCLNNPTNPFCPLELPSSTGYNTFCNGPNCVVDYSKGIVKNPTRECNPSNNTCSGCELGQDVSSTGDCCDGEWYFDILSNEKCCEGKIIEQRSCSGNVCANGYGDFVCSTDATPVNNFCTKDLDCANCPEGEIYCGGACCGGINGKVPICDYPTNCVDGNCVKGQELVCNPSQDCSDEYDCGCLDGEILCGGQCCNGTCNAGICTDPVFSCEENGSPCESICDTGSFCQTDFDSWDGFKYEGSCVDLGFGCMTNIQQSCNFDYDCEVWTPSVKLNLNKASLSTSDYDLINNKKIKLFDFDGKNFWEGIITKENNEYFVKFGRDITQGPLSVGGYNISNSYLTDARDPNYEIHLDLPNVADFYCTNCDPNSSCYEGDYSQFPICDINNYDYDVDLILIEKSNVNNLKINIINNGSLRIDPNYLLGRSVSIKNQSNGTKYHSLIEIDPYNTAKLIARFNNVDVGVYDLNQLNFDLSEFVLPIKFDDSKLNNILVQQGDNVYDINAIKGYAYKVNILDNGKLIPYNDLNFYYYCEQVSVRDRIKKEVCNDLNNDVSGIKKKPFVEAGFHSESKFLKREYSIEHKGVEKIFNVPVEMGLKEVDWVFSSSCVDFDYSIEKVFLVDENVYFDLKLNCIQNANDFVVDVFSNGVLVDSNTDLNCPGLINFGPLSEEGFYNIDIYQIGCEKKSSFEPIFKTSEQINIPENNFFLVILLLGLIIGLIKIKKINFL